MDPKSSPLQPLQQSLTAQLQSARDIAVLAVGSELFGDDAVALKIAELLEPYSETDKRLHIFIGSNAPENCTGPIRRLNPSHLIVIDAADIGKAAGTIEQLNMGQLEGVTFCTHALPLNVVVDYILKACPDCKAFVLGIQPTALRFGEPLSTPVEVAAREVAEMIIQAVSG